MSLEFENAIAIQPVEGSGSGLQFQNTIYIQPKDEGGDTPSGKYIIPTLFNMQYNGAGTGLYSSNSTSACQYLSSSSEGRIDFKQRSGQTLTTSNLYDIGYIDIPYTLGKLITVCQLDTSLTSSHPIRSIVFGKINGQGNFVPILYSDNSSDSVTLTIGITTDDNISSIVGIGGTHYTTSQTWDASQTSNTVHKTDGAISTTTYGGYIRLYETDNGIQLLAYDGGAFRTAGYTEVFINSKSITGSTLVARIKEITTARIIPAQYMGISENTAISKAGIGLFDSNITSFNSFATTKYTFADIGENLLKWTT